MKQDGIDKLRELAANLVPPASQQYPGRTEHLLAEALTVIAYELEHLRETKARKP